MINRIYQFYRKIRAKMFIFSGRLVFLLLALLRPFFSLRFALLRSDRFGEMLLNTDIFLRRNRVGDNQGAVLFIPYMGNSCANQYLLDKIKTLVRVWDWKIVREWFARNMRLFSGTDFFYDYQVRQNYLHLYDGNLEPVFSFTEQENEKGQAFLKKIGLQEGDWYVCIFARDSFYLNKHFSSIPGSPVSDYNNDFRNSDIESFRQACEFIVSEGGWVFRMGAEVEKPLSFAGERIIDYASCHRTEFLDIFLPANCLFALGDSSGGNHTATVFNRPIAYTNWIPTGFPPYFDKDIYIPKYLIRKEDGSRLPFYELSAMGDPETRCATDFYRQQGLFWENNSAEEIEALAMEMLNRLRGKFVIDALGKELVKNHYHALGLSGEKGRGLAEVAFFFLQKNRDLFFPGR
jgi:putative glycosyltransferase (TIGR04372 family)